MPKIDVKQIVDEWKQELKTQVKPYMKLSIIQIGDDLASNIYIKGKKKDCEELGIQCKHFKYDKTVSPDLIYQHIKEASNPIMIQLPVPNQIDLNVINQIIPLNYDVDGFSPFSKFLPCTPGGIVYLLDKIKFEYEYHQAVIIGRSQIVGRPMANILLDKNMTVSICHSKTSFYDMVNLCNNADLIISAVGKPKFITDMLIDGLKSQILIDVGINRENGKICGDADASIYKNPYLKYTPVPNGVGLLTRMQLMQNVVDAYKI